jgi:hypothetical protein
MQKAKLEGSYMWHCELYFEISMYDEANYVKQKSMHANQTSNSEMNKVLSAEFVLISIFII